jgi:hypothetical protein
VELLKAEDWPWLRVAVHIAQSWMSYRREQRPHHAAIWSGECQTGSKNSWSKI